jgi:hypothetical protein
MSSHSRSLAVPARQVSQQERNKLIDRGHVSKINKACKDNRCWGCGNGNVELSYVKHCIYFWLQCTAAKIRFQLDYLEAAAINGRLRDVNPGDRTSGMIASGNFGMADVHLKRYLLIRAFANYPIHAWLTLRTFINHDNIFRTVKAHNDRFPNTDAAEQRDFHRHIRPLKSLMKKLTSCSNSATLAAEHVSLDAVLHDLIRRDEPLMPAGLPIYGEESKRWFQPHGQHENRTMFADMNATWHFLQLVHGGKAVDDAVEAVRPEVDALTKTVAPAPAEIGEYASKLEARRLRFGPAPAAAAAAIGVEPARLEARQNRSAAGTAPVPSDAPAKRGRNDAPEASATDADVTEEEKRRWRAKRFGIGDEPTTDKRPRWDVFR